MAWSFGPGAPRVLPPSDFAVYTNEQFGFIAALVDNTNHVFAFALPYPSGINLENQTIRIRAMDLQVHMSEQDHISTNMLAAYFSMLDMEFDSDFTVLDDGEDEKIRAHFDGPMEFGTRSAVMADSTAGAAWGTLDAGLISQHHRYYPWQTSVDLLTPQYVQLVKHHSYATGVDSAVLPANASFGDFEQTTIKPIFEVRSLTSREKSIRGNQFQWMRLNS